MRSYELRLTVRRLVAAVATILGVALAPAAAHEIPDAVKVEAFFRPAGQRLELLMRVPMQALIEVDFPTRGPGYINLPRVEEALHGAVQLYITDNITVYENEAALPTPRVAQVRISLPSDRSFTSYETALANLHGPRVADDLELYWNQQLLDVLLEYPIKSDRSKFSIHPRVDRYGAKVTTALVFMPPGAATRAFEFHADPGRVYLDPSWQQAAGRFVSEGFWQVLNGTEHLLVVLCLVIPFRRLRSVVLIIPAFAAAHSISLFAAAVGFVSDALWFPPLIETLIAASILYLAIENIVGTAVSRRWIFAFAFGLLHGFAFSFTLRETVQFAGDHLVTALFGFNLGVELALFLVLVVLMPALDLLFKYVVAERLGIIILSALMAHTAWHWMIERGEQLAKFRFPKIDAALLASAMRGLMAVLILAGLLALVNNMLKRWIASATISPARDPAE